MINKFIYIVRVNKIFILRIGLLLRSKTILLYIQANLYNLTNFVLLVFTCLFNLS